MMQKNTKTVKQVKKPFLPGNPTDENTVKKILKFFGLHILLFFVTFIVSSLSSFNIVALRIAVNAAIGILCLFIMFNKGRGDGSDAVARGEILYQRKEKGLEVTEGERKLSFHPLKGFLNAILGLFPFLIIAIIIAVTAQKQITGYGVLPSWMSTYTRQGEIGDALIAYTNPAGMSFMDILRVVLRLCMMPVVGMIGAENKELILLAERLSPIILLLPSVSYGVGYLQGPKDRSRVHTEIAENIKKRKHREKKERKIRLSFQPKEPEKLN